MIVTQVTNQSTTIYLHRTVTHGALGLHPKVALVFRLWLWITTGIIRRDWVAIHRKHHAFTDREGDPHSPILKGFWSVQLGNIYHYNREARNQAVIDRYSQDITDDWWERTFFKHGKIGITLGVIILCNILGIGWGLLAAGIHAFTYVFVFTSSINGLCHSQKVGYQNYPDNTASNVPWVAIWTAGEGLHNNHHHFQRSPKLSVKPGEIDPAWPVIKFLQRIGLAKF
jgi:stearoyl-CoA desaturase (Delta-9 desaturase)